MSSALAMIAAAVRGQPSRLDATWRGGLRREHVERANRYVSELDAAALGNDGRMHPNRIFAAMRRVLRDDAIGIADGGDILSFGRLGLAPTTYLDSGAFGCLGVGVPFANAAALAYPDRQVVAICGDGAFGLHAERVTDPRLLDAALARALERAPALLDVAVTRDTVSSDLAKGLSVVPGYQALTAWDNAERERFRIDEPR